MPVDRVSWECFNNRAIATSSPIRSSDPAGLAEFLNRDWPWAGFAIGDLEPGLMPHCEWWLDGGTLVLLCDILNPRLLCHYGDGTNLGRILRGARDERVWVNIRPEFEQEFFKYYRAEKCVRMRRMYLDSPVEPQGAAERLTARDEADVRQLLSQGEWVLFLPDMLGCGHYFGVRDPGDNGKLVSVAGVHLASQQFDIAALGTVFTHPDYRGRGLAATCSSHVIASVQETGIRRMVLNVEDAKAGARRVYERLGFKTACVYLDGECVRIADGADDGGGG